MDADKKADYQLADTGKLISTHRLGRYIRNRLYVEKLDLFGG
jgi:hypothetical protein